MTTTSTALPGTGISQTYPEIERPTDPELGADFDVLISIAEAHCLPDSAVVSLLELGSRCAHRGGAAALAQQQSNWEATRAAWIRDLKNDPEIGAENFETARALALRTVETFGGPGLSAVFNAGWGDNPAMFKFCVAIGKKLSPEAEQVPGANPDV